ncbi:MAG: hypothetical protein ACRCY8_01915, partial [Dermatophilaceae bacterium]
MSMDPKKRWRAVSVGAAVIAVVAVGGLVAQALTAPDDATGTSLAEARSSTSPSPSASPTPTASPTSTATTPALPKPKTRDASLDALTTTTD